MSYYIVKSTALTVDYWDVRWDLTEKVKKAFDTAGIGIPYPQQDLHLFVEKK